MEQRIESALALRDYGTRQDIADAALFLCSSHERYITGTILDCDGGTSPGDA
jgi:NAD(P)-dependent dehydrogenase (short-subunit alcohol dehydrogenase family)